MPDPTSAMRLLVSLIVLGWSAAASWAQPVRSSPARSAEGRLSIEVFENGAYRVLRTDEEPATSSIDATLRWRGLVDGERVNEEAFFEHAGEWYLAQKAAHEHLGMRQAVVGGILAFVAGGVLIATAELLPEDSRWGRTQQGLGASAAVAGLAISSVGIHSLGRNTTTVWEAHRVATQHNARADEGRP